MSCVVTCRRRVLSSCTGLASEFGDLNAEEIKLHAEVDIDSGASAMVISEIALHKLDLEETSELKFSKTSFKRLTGSDGFAMNILVIMFLRMSSTFCWIYTLSSILLCDMIYSFAVKHRE